MTFLISLNSISVFCLCLRWKLRKYDIIKRISEPETWKFLNKKSPECHCLNLIKLGYGLCSILFQENAHHRIECYHILIECFYVYITRCTAFGSVREMYTSDYVLMTALTASAFKSNFCGNSAMKYQPIVSHLHKRKFHSEWMIAFSW